MAEHIWLKKEKSSDRHAQSAFPKKTVKVEKTIAPVYQTASKFDHSDFYATSSQWQSAASAHGSPQGIVQGVQLYIAGFSTKCDMVDNGDGTYSYQGMIYVPTGNVDRWGLPIVTLLEAAPAPIPAPAPKFGENSALQIFEEEGSTDITTPFGRTHAHTGWGGQPFITSKKEDYGGAAVGNRYTDIISSLRSGGKSDQEIATKLLNEDSSGMTDKERRGAAMCDSIVGVGEEFRVEGSARVCRAALRTIEDGSATFDEFPDYFQMAESKKDGEAQVEHLEYLQEHPSQPPSPHSKAILDRLSPTKK